MTLREKIWWFWRDNRRDGGPFFWFGVYVFLICEVIEFAGGLVTVWPYILVVNGITLLFMLGLAFVFGTYISWRHVLSYEKCILEMFSSPTDERMTHGQIASVLGAKEEEFWPINCACQVLLKRKFIAVDERSSFRITRYGKERYRALCGIALVPTQRG